MAGLLLVPIMAEVRSLRRRNERGGPSSVPWLCSARQHALPYVGLIHEPRRNRRPLLVAATDNCLRVDVDREREMPKSVEHPSIPRIWSLRFGHVGNREHVDSDGGHVTGGDNAVCNVAPNLPQTYVIFKPEGSFRTPGPSTVRTTFPRRFRWNIGLGLKFQPKRSRQREIASGFATATPHGAGSVRPQQHENQLVGAQLALGTFVVYVPVMAILHLPYAAAS
jgi:hypothetical protein